MQRSGIVAAPRVSEEAPLLTDIERLPSPDQMQEAQASLAREPCPRCRGRMLSTGVEGDLGCFSCGHLIYAVAPEAHMDVRRRGASHGGESLD